MESTLAALEKYDIDPKTLTEWERELNLTIPTDETGNKRYSPHHINLFKNIRKHLALGRTLSQIRDMVTLPPADQAKPLGKPGVYVTQPMPNRVQAKALEPKAMTAPYVNGANAVDTAATPSLSVLYTPTPGGDTSPVVMENADSVAVPSVASFQPEVANHDKLLSAVSPAAQPNALLTLVERLMAEKDQLNKKLMETEKLNSHLYNANALFHRKVKEHAAQSEQLKAQLENMQAQQSESDPVRHLDEKSRLHRQLLDMEKHLLNANQQIVMKEQTIQQMQQHAGLLENRLKDAHKPLPAETFIGCWQENAQLLEVSYDSFGINFEAERQRRLNIPETPQRVYGGAAVLVSQYDYEANPMWKRHETLFINCVDDNQLAGELVTEFLLDGVPVGKAIYTINCQRLAE